MSNFEMFPQTARINAEKMPLSRIIHKSNSSILVWRLDETLEWWIDHSNHRTLESEKYRGAGIDKRRIEILCTHKLVEFALGEKCLPIHYKGNSPILRESFISISHSDKEVVVILSENRCAVDIEPIHQRVKKVRDRFLSINELQAFGTDNVERLTLLWSIKEVVYKLVSLPGLSFKDAIEIENFAMNQNGQTRVKVKWNKNVVMLKVNFRKLNGSWLSFSESKMTFTDDA